MKQKVKWMSESKKKEKNCRWGFWTFAYKCLTIVRLSVVGCWLSFALWRGTNTIYARRRRPLVPSQRQMLFFFYHSVCVFYTNRKLFNSVASVRWDFAKQPSKPCHPNRKLELELMPCFNRATKFYYTTLMFGCDKIPNVNIWVGFDTNFRELTKCVEVFFFTGNKLYRTVCLNFNRTQETVSNI